MPPVVKVLFVGANMEFQDELLLSEEFEILQEAFVKGCREKRSDVVESVQFDLRFWRTGMLGKKIGRIKPTIMVLACHGEDASGKDGAGLYISNLGSGFVDDDTLLRNILSSNQEVDPEKRIRLLVINACKSADLAKKFHLGGDFAGQHLKGIEFVIGHGISVEETAVHGFSEALFSNLGHGKSLHKTFFNAENASRLTTHPGNASSRLVEGYQLFQVFFDSRHGGERCRAGQARSQDSVRRDEEGCEKVSSA